MNNRIYKVRAWSEEYKVMKQLTLLGLMWECDNNPPVYGLDLPDDEPVPLYSDVKLMQFIGLKDMKNVEVYEGDILRYRDSFDIETIGKVVYNNNYARFVLEADAGINVDDFMDLASDDFEVIGNLFENPELLKEDK